MGTSGGKRTVHGMEPPDLLVELGEVEGRSSGGTGFPSLSEIRTSQQQIQVAQRQWLATCRDLCEVRLPPEVFKLIPRDIWKFCPWGTKVVVMRAPKIDRHGSLIVPAQAQRSNFHGWILTVGKDICLPDQQDQIVRGKSCPYVGPAGFNPVYDPLLLVGEMVQFNPFQGKELSTSRQLPPSEQREFLLTSIADIFGPIPDPEPEDWSTSI